MKSADQKKYLWFSLLLPGYVETIRLAVFYALGWSQTGQALGLVAVLAVTRVLLNYAGAGKGMKFTFSLFLGLLCSAFLLEYKTDVIWSVPVSKLTSLPQPDFSLFGVIPPVILKFGIISLYVLMILSLTAFMLERKSAPEIFCFGTALLAVSVLTGDSGVFIYLALNVVFGVSLYSLLYFLSREGDPRRRNVLGTGLNLNKWVGLSFVLTLGVVALGAVIPAVESVPKTDKLWNKRGYLSVDTKDSFGLFWQKAESFKLQGSIQLDDRPIMYIKAPRPFYWRGESSDFYTGRGWRNTLIERELRDKDLVNPYAQGVPVEQVKQEITLAPWMKTRAVFSTGFLASVHLPEGRLTTDEGGNIYTEYNKPGFSYRAVSYLPQTDPIEFSGEDPALIKRLYLQLPGNLPERVKQLAVSLTERSPNRLEKVKEIERYLSINYPYDLKVTRVSDQQDVVDSFLFELKRGYCTYHSTAMVVMLRSLGIPARWVKGFAEGSFNSTTGEYEIRMNDSHAWVEVYFPGYGWKPFEPTPNFKLPGKIVPLGNLPGVQESPPPTDFIGANLFKGQPGHKYRILGFSIIPLGIVLTVFAANRKRRSERMTGFPSGDKIQDIYLSLIKALSLRGYTRSQGQTPLEFAGELESNFKVEHTDILCIINAFLQTRYSEHKPSNTDLKEVEDAWKRVSDRLLKV